MKRVFLLLVMIVAGSFLGNVETILAEDGEQYEYGEFIYEIQDGTVKIVEVNEDVVSVTIPSVIDNMPVTAIDEEIFSWLSGVEEVIIPESVSWIEAGAFSWCGHLNRITVDSNNEYYTDIEGVLFEKKNKMLHTYPEGKSVQKYSIPEGTVGIGEEAFFACDELIEIWIPESVNVIGTSAVSLCYNLQSIVVSADNEVYSDTNGILFEKKRKVLLKYPEGKYDLEYSIPEGTIRIGEEAFRSCRNLTKVRIPDSVTTIGESAFACCEELTEVIMPDTLSAINKSTFYDCRELTEIKIPKETTEIGQIAFWSCYSLTEIWIPESVSKIGTGAFDVCTSLCAIRVAPDNDNYADIDGVLFEKKTKMLQKYPVGKSGSEYSIPEGTIEIGEDAFLGSNLYKIIIPNSVKSIEGDAFKDCDNLTLVVNKDSYAYEYAKTNGIPYQFIDSENWLLN